MKACQYLSLLTLVFFLACEAPPSIKTPNYFPQSNRIFFDSVRLETISLGEKLFFDKRLSKNDSISCASCHFSNLAFTDGKPISQGIYGRFSRHNSSTLLNIGYSPTFMFDMRSHDLEIQPIVPIEDTNEMSSNYDEIEKKLASDSTYQYLARKLYGIPLNRRSLTLALAAYMKSLISADSKYDDFLKSKDSLLFSKNEKRGMAIFFGKGNCNECHTAPLFTNYQHYNLGLEDSLTGRIGKMGATHQPLDRGRFKTPTLRNIEITFPYFHDGRSKNLKEAVNHHLNTDRKTYDYTPAILTETENLDLVLFLKTLTDKKYKKTASLPLK